MGRSCTRFRRRTTEATLLALSVVAMTSGCKENEKPIEIITLEGRIEKIKRSTDTTGEITVVFYSEKQRQEITGTATVTEETEILLDGAAAKLKDLLDGERIRGQVRVEKRGEQKTNIVLKIQVDRARPDGGS